LIELILLLTEFIDKMPLFETTIQINPEDVAKIVQENWNISLGKLIKGSQNHTFEGVRVSL